MMFPAGGGNRKAARPARPPPGMNTMSGPVGAPSKTHV